MCVCLRMWVIVYWCVCLCFSPVYALMLHVRRSVEGKWAKAARANVSIWFPFVCLLARVLFFWKWESSLLVTLSLIHVSLKQDERGGLWLMQPSHASPSAVLIDNALTAAAAVAAFHRDGKRKKNLSRLKPVVYSSRRLISAIVFFCFFHFHYLLSIYWFIFPFFWFQRLILSRFTKNPHLVLSDFCQFREQPNKCLQN